MLKQTMTIGLKGGLAARSIAELVQLTSSYESRIYIELGTKRVNGKSIMGMMSLELDCGDKIDVSADGSDEEAALKAVDDYVSGRK